MERVRLSRICEPPQTGFDADILAVDGNPLQDLAAIRRLRAVYARGVPVIPAPDFRASAEAQ